jgi:hypothetical protein
LIPGAERPGTTPPRVEARISSSVASHDFIFSARLTDDGEEDDDDEEEVSTSPLPSAEARMCTGRRWEDNAPLPSPIATVDGPGVVLLDERWRVNGRDDEDSEKASEASTMAATIRRRRQRDIVGCCRCGG